MARLPIRAATSSIDDDDFEIIDVPGKGRTRTAQEFPQLLEAMRKQVKLLGKSPIFHVSLGTGNRYLLFDQLIAGLPQEHQGEMRCRACKHFMKLYGDLCIVDDDGNLVPLSWSFNADDLPSFFQQSVRNLQAAFKDKEVGDEFMTQLCSSTTLGLPESNGHSHLSIVLDNVRVQGRYSDSQDTATSYTMLKQVLEENSLEVIKRVHHMIHEDQLPYSTAHKESLEYLKNVAIKLDGVSGVQRKNLITRFAREAFFGRLSSLRGGLLGYLFECVNEGQSFAVIKKNWTAKADPMHYMRPIAAPSVSNIESAEKIFSTLGFTPYDLERQYLTIDQVPKSAIMWSPILTTKKLAPEQETGAPARLFGSVIPKPIVKQIPINKTNAYSQAPIKDVSFRHFALKILPTLKSMDISIKDQIQPYFFTTGKENSKPIMYFHKEGGHTASWYTWQETQRAKQAQMKAGTWTPVTALTTFPHMWDHFDNIKDALDWEKMDAFQNKREGIRFLFCVEKAREVTPQYLCLFPSLMRNEFHGVRKTVEAFSSKGKIEQPDADKEVVGGFSVESDKKSDLLLAVTTKEGQISRYRITLFE